MSMILSLNILFLTYIWQYLYLQVSNPLNIFLRKTRLRNTLLKEDDCLDEFYMFKSKYNFS